jgi:outer membrane protein assembly factor BamB
VDRDQSAEDRRSGLLTDLGEQAECGGEQRDFEEESGDPRDRHGDVLGVVARVVRDAKEPPDEGRNEREPHGPAHAEEAGVGRPAPVCERSERGQFEHEAKGRVRDIEVHRPSRGEQLANLLSRPGGYKSPGDPPTAMQRRRFLASLGAAAALAGCSQLPLSGDGERGVPGEFPERAVAQFRGGLRRQGYYPERSVPDAVEVAWSLPDVNTGDHTAAKASFVEDADGNLVLPGDSGNIWSLTPDGDVRWEADVTEATRGIHGTAAIANGTAYIGAYDGALSAFDVETGERYWRTDLGDAIGSSPAYYDGTVYIAVEHSSPSGSVHALDAATGEETWSDHKPTDHPHSSIAIDREGGWLTVGSNDGKLYGWSYPDLDYRWQFDTGDPIKGPIAIADGAAIFGSWSDYVYSVDLATGERNWRTKTLNYVMSGATIDPDHGVCYIGSHDNDLHCLDLATGERQWTAPAYGRIVGCPVSVGDRVLFGSIDARLYCVDAADGSEVWSVLNDGYVTSTPLVTDDGIYYAERAPDGGANGENGNAYKLVAA